MSIEQQQDVIDFLGASTTHGGQPVERIDTHISIVFLAGARALKLKRAVRFDYVDFSTPALRRAACEAELRINRRTAPALYRSVSAVTREADGTLALNGSGVAVDWVVDMARFDQDALFDRLARRGALDLALMPPLASAIADFHRIATPRVDHGGRQGMSWVIEGNAQGFTTQGSGILDPGRCTRVIERSRAELDRLGDLLERRRATGHVRECHGDLHLRNIVLLNGRPVLFDGVEFNDEIACTDVLYDLAFLIMDLWRLRLGGHANAVFNRYLSETGDFEGLVLFPLFLSCRAAIRAKTSATTARVQADAARARVAEALAQEYLAMAAELLEPSPPRLVAIGGLSGSGKSTLARSLAAVIGTAPGALVVRSDEIRKALSGVFPLARLGPEGYTPEMTSRVYRAVADRAVMALTAGRSVVVDAVFARESDRSAIQAAAESASAPFHGLWLDAPGPVLTARATQRLRDASDADASVIERQLAAGSGDVAWPRLDATQAPDTVMADAQALLASALPRWPAGVHGAEGRVASVNESRGSAP
jgi:aminoglycoside phosphotransferase family enzyme/predicted kinase